MGLFNVIMCCGACIAAQKCRPNAHHDYFN